MRFLRPELEPEPAGVWICPYEILGLPRGRRWLRAAPGVDEVQAVMGALKAVARDLHFLQEDGLDIRWLGQRDLGFLAALEGEPPRAGWRRDRRRAPARGPVPIYRHRGGGEG